MMERALRDATLRTDERLKVACVVARSGSSSLSGDSISFLTRWACEEICRVYNKKNRNPPAVDVCSKLWVFLATMMESWQLTSRTTEEGSVLVPRKEAQLVSVHLLQAMGEVLGSHGARENCVQSVLKCLLCVFSNQPTLPPILYKFEVVVSLLLALLVSVTNACRREEELVSGSPLAEKVLCFLLDHFSYLQRTQGNQKKVFKAVCGQLLDPLIRLRESTLVRNGSELLLTKLDILLCSLFGRDHLLEFSSALSGSMPSIDASTTAPSGSRGASSEMSYTKLLFSTLWDLLHNDATTDHNREAVLNATPTLFQGFLHQNRELKKLSKAIEFNFFMKMLWIIGFPLPATSASGKGECVRESGRKRAKIDSTEREEGSDESWEDGEMWGGEEGMEEEGEEVAEEDEEEEEEEEEKDAEIDWEVLLVRIDSVPETRDDATIKEPELEVLKTCLHLLRVHNVYQVMEDQSQGSRQFNSLCCLCTEVVKNINNSNMALSAECLCEALQVNHKLVELLLTGLLLLATCTNTTRGRMDSFIKQCITTYSKLHQMGVLVDSLFSALEKLARSPDLPATFAPAFSKPSEDWFCRHVQEMPTGQCVALLEQVTNSLQSAFISKLRPEANGSRETMEECSPRKRKGRKRHRSQENRTFAAMQNEDKVVSSCFASALLRGVDVLSLILTNSQLSMWTSGGLHRERAREALLAVQRDIHMPLTVAAENRPELVTAVLHLMHNLHVVLFCLRDIFSDPPLQPPSPVADDGSDSKLQTTATTSSFWRSKEMEKFLWSQGEGSEQVPELRMTGNGTESAAKFILKALGVQQLRFVKDDLSPEVLVKHMDEVFRQMECALDHKSSWSGQQLDVNERNFPIAAWDLALSNLPQLPSSCLLPAHLSNIASFVHSALSSEGEGESEGVGITARKVAHRFLDSEGFLDNRDLQGAVLGVCFEQTATCLPKSLKELKSSLLGCGSQLQDSSEHLTKAIELGLQLLAGEEEPAKKRKSLSKSPQNISVCLEVMRAVPMAYYPHPELLHRCVLVLSILHISLVESLCHREAVCESMKERNQQLCEVQLVLSWVLQSAAHCDRVGKKNTRRLSPLPFPDLLSWFYSASRQCIERIEDDEKKFETSSLLLMEAVQENTLKSGIYPTSFVHVVVKDLKTALVGCSEEATAVGIKDSLSESVLHLTVAKLCKLYSDLKPGQRDDSFHETMEELLRKTEGCLSRAKNRSLFSHPQLVSSFSLLLRTSTPSLSNNLLSKCLAMARWLSEKLCCEQSLQGTPLSVLCPVLDVLSISATVTEDDAKTVCLSLTASWSASVKLMKSFLKKELEISSDSYLTELLSGTSESSECSNTGSGAKSLHVALPQLSRLMSRLLSSADRDQAKSIFESLHNESCEDVATALALCHCWGLVLSARLQSESQRELRKWHTKILLQCGSLAVQHRGVAPIIILSTNIAIRLVALPAKVGLDSRLVLMSLHQTGVITDITELKNQRCVMKVLQSVSQLLLTVLKHHSSVTTSCPGPIITTTNNLVRTALEQCAVKGEGVRGERISADVSNTLSRVLDRLASQQEFNKYIPCVLGSCVTAIVKNLPPKPVKTSLLPGVYALMRHCSDEGTASVQVCLDANTRSHFQTLVEDFKKQKRFL